MIMKSNYILPNEVIYLEQQIEAFKGNPLIEALPKYTENEVLKIITRDSKVLEEEKLYGHMKRIEIIKLKYDSLIIPRYYDLEIYNELDFNIRTSYSSRNPFDPNAVRYKNFLAKVSRSDKDLESTMLRYNNAAVNINSDYDRNSKVITIIGSSGVGKSKCISNVLRCYPKVVYHKAYKDKTFINAQVISVYVNCAPNMTIKSLMYEICNQIALITGEKIPTSLERGTTQSIKNNAIRFIQKYNVGVIILDEIQELASTRNRREEILGFLMSLVNTINTSMVWIGTPNAKKMIQEEFRVARRAGKIYEIELLKENSYEWDIFLKKLWNIQITRNYTPLTEEIKDILFLCTQGIVDLLSKLILATQIEVIKEDLVKINNIKSFEKSNNREVITSKDILNVYEMYFKSVHPIINAIRDGDESAIIKYIDIDTNDIIENISINKKIKKKYDIINGNDYIYKFED